MAKDAEEHEAVHHDLPDIEVAAQFHFARSLPTRGQRRQLTKNAAEMQICATIPI
jgi:hypothetical protein